MAETKVYSWSGEHGGPQHAGGWVAVTWAAAVSSLAELRGLCRQSGVTYPRTPFRPGPGREEWRAAAQHPGSLVMRNDEPTGDQTGDWQVLPADGSA